MYTYNYKVTFSECDPGGVIYFAAVFDIAHRAYEEFMELADFRRDYFNNDRLAIPIIKSEAEYHEPLILHESIKVNLSVERTGNTSFSLAYSFVGEDDKIKASVKTVHVVIDKSDGKKTTLPEELRDHLQTSRS